MIKVTFKHISFDSASIYYDVFIKYRSDTAVFNNRTVISLSELEELKESLISIAKAIDDELTGTQSA